MSTFPIFCNTCGATGSVNKVTASLRCACGSDDLGLEGLDVKTAAPRGDQSGWQSTNRDPLSGWDEYQGPAPTPNPLVNQDLVSDSNACPACNGTGHDGRASGGGYDENTCRLCGGSGRYTPPTGRSGPESFDATTTGPASGGARWQGRGASITFPNGKKAVAKVTYKTATGHYDQHLLGQETADPSNVVALSAPCPFCASNNTNVVKDASDKAWWNCPNCGSLANLHENPKLDPQSPGFGFKPDHSFKPKTSKKASANKLFTMVAAIKARNDVTDDTAFTLARKALALQTGGE